LVGASVSVLGDPELGCCGADYSSKSLVFVVTDTILLQQFRSISHLYLWWMRTVSTLLTAQCCARCITLKPTKILSLTLQINMI